MLAASISSGSEATLRRAAEGPVFRRAPASPRKIRPGSPRPRFPRCASRSRTESGRHCQPKKTRDPGVHPAQRRNAFSTGSQRRHREELAAAEMSLSSDCASDYKAQTHAKGGTHHEPQAAPQAIATSVHQGKRRRRIDRHFSILPGCGDDDAAYLCPPPRTGMIGYAWRTGGLGVAQCNGGPGGVLYSLQNVFAAAPPDSALKFVGCDFSNAIIESDGSSLIDLDGLNLSMRSRQRHRGICMPKATVGPTPASLWIGWDRPSRNGKDRMSLGARNL